MRTRLTATLAVLGVMALGTGVAYGSGTGECPYGNEPGTGAQVQKQSQTPRGEQLQLRQRDGTGTARAQRRARRNASARKGGDRQHSQARLRDGSCR